MKPNWIFIAFGALVVAASFSLAVLEGARAAHQSASDGEVHIAAR